MDSRDMYHEQLPPFDPARPDLSADPYPFYQHYRTLDPVHRGLPFEPSHRVTWYLFGYAECSTLLHDNRLGRELHKHMPQTAQPALPQAFMPLAQITSSMMLFRDPPDHTRLRALVNKAFTPRVAQNLAGRIEAITNELLDAVAAGQMDVIADLAFPLPVTVIAELLGMPVSDWALLRTWSVAFTRAIDVRQESEMATILGNATAAVVEFSAYFRDIIDARRRQPQADLISALLDAQEAGSRLDENELIAMCFLLLAAGHETTVNLIGNSVLALLQHPEQLALLRQNPSLAESAVNEVLRYESPVQVTIRSVLSDVEIAGKHLRQGEYAAFLLGAANRDPAVFPEPDRLDITRRAANHLAFGQGIHFCLGAPLARLEGAIALRTLIQRWPHLSLATAPSVLTWRQGLAFHGVVALPVVFCA